MKFFAPIIVISFFLISCSRHRVPAKTTAAVVTNNSKKTYSANSSNSTNKMVAPNSAPAASAPVFVNTKPIIVVDGRGNILITEKDLPPDASADVLNIKNARGFTPEQVNNLAYRFKTIPPKILYVPSALAKASSRGTYYVYNKKFYFWKKPDGYFYLDETYYN
ncbi:MAG: hypothetical protein ACR2FN_07570 [Chitinophagaceae bacterium]